MPCRKALLDSPQLPEQSITATTQITLGGPDNTVNAPESSRKKFGLWQPDYSLIN